MIKSGNVKAAIFDLDGTIADSLWVWRHIDLEFFKKRDMELPDDYMDAVKSMGFIQAAAYTKKRFSLPLSESEIIDEWFSMAEHEYACNVKIKDGVSDYLKLLRKNGIKVGLATASGRKLYEPLLERYNMLRLFDAFATTGEAGKDKNHPDVYLLCAKRLNTEPSSCIVFEDIFPGAKAASSIGMKIVGVYDKYSASEREDIEKISDCYIEDFYNAPSLNK